MLNAQLVECDEKLLYVRTYFILIRIDLFGKAIYTES